MGGQERVTLSFTIEATRSAVAALPRNHGALGRYVLLQVIGHGGMGVVWQAYDPVLDRKIALKLIVPSADARGQIVAEAQAMARVQHPNVVTVHDAGIHRTGDHELAYVAMELVDGGTLKQWLEDPARSLEQRLDMFMRAGAGLEAAHAAGLVHRDFKPSNVLLGDGGRVRVSDFGLALLSSDEPGGADGEAARGQADPNAIAGTPRYMSPEQLDGRPADARSDQFAFCVALYEAVFGTHPFAPEVETPTLAQLRARVRAPSVPAPRSRLAARLAPVILRGLAADPSRRWGSMRELLAALDGARRRRGRRTVLVATFTAVVAAAVGLVGWRETVALPHACQRAADAVGMTWTAQRRQRLAAAFARLGTRGTDVWPRLQAVLDQWASRWRSLRVEQCEADRNGARPSAPLTAQRECLARRLGELDGLLRALDDPDETVANYAVRAAHGLTPPESCLSALPPAGAGARPPARDRVARVRAHIDRASALRRLWKLRPALDDAKQAAAEAARLDWAPLTAEAQLELGRALLQLVSADPATDAFYQALWTAEAARDDALRFEAAIGLYHSSLQRSSYAMAARWLGTARAIARHLPADATREARLGYLETRLAAFGAKPKQCIQSGEPALRLAQRAAPNTQLFVKLLINLSRCYGDLDDEDTAVAYLRRALPISEKINGHQDQQTASILMELGVHARRAHHYDAALTYYRDVLAIRERMAGPDDPDCASIHNNIGNVLRDEGRYQEARREYEGAIAVWTRRFGTDSPAVAMGLNGLGRLALLEGQPARAERMFRRALEIRKKKRPPGHRDITSSVALVAQALLAERRREALPLFEQVLAAIERDGNTTAIDRAEARFWAARARVTLGVHAAGALAEAQASCKALDTPASHDDFEMCSTWLRDQAAGAR